MRDADIASQPLSTAAENSSRQVVERAVGVLILALRLAPDAAAHLLSGVSRGHLLAEERLGAAILAAASGEHLDDPVARKVAWQEWVTCSYDDVAGLWLHPRPILGRVTCTSTCLAASA